MNNFSPFNNEMPEQQFQPYLESKEDSKEFEFLVEIDDNQSIVRNEEVVGQYLPEEDPFRVVAASVENMREVIKREL